MSSYLYGVRATVLKPKLCKSWSQSHWEGVCTRDAPLGVTVRQQSTWLGKCLVTVYYFHCHTLVLKTSLSTCFWCFARWNKRPACNWEKAGVWGAATDYMTAVKADNNSPCIYGACLKRMMRKVLGKSLSRWSVNGKTKSPCSDARCLCRCSREMIREASRIRKIPELILKLNCYHARQNTPLPLLLGKTVIIKLYRRWSKGQTSTSFTL